MPANIFQLIQEIHALPEPRPATLPYLRSTIANCSTAKLRWPIHENSGVRVSRRPPCFCRSPELSRGEVEGSGGALLPIGLAFQDDLRNGVLGSVGEREGNVYRS
jgi:hypothetical protein